MMGWICDKFGARRGLSYLLLGTIPAIVLMMFVQAPWQFIVLRCIIGFSLATFVACRKLHPCLRPGPRYTPGAPGALRLQTCSRGIARET